MHERDETEWQRQEAARQGVGDDAAYRLMAQTLAWPSPVQLPADFAAQVARLATARSAAAAASYEWMLGGFALALTAGAAWVALHLNPDLAARLFTLVFDARLAAITDITTITSIHQGKAGWLLWLGLALVAATFRPQSLKPQRHA
jgi:hypothetical protein